MYIKNTSSKIISIGTTVLLPDAIMETDKETTLLPAISAFIQKGFIVVEEDRPRFALPTQYSREAADANQEDNVPAMRELSSGNGEIEGDGENPKNIDDGTGSSENPKDGAVRKRSRRAPGASETNADEKIVE